SNGLFSKIRNSNFVDHISLKRGILKIDLSQTAISSYHASFIATYLCERLFETGRSFCYETVLSHPDKIKYIDLARTKSFRTYAYFIFTDNVEVNILRVKIRVLQGLHDVDEKKIRSRYKRTFRNIYQLMLRCDDGYLIGNSNEIEVIGELKNGQLTILKPLPSFLQIHLKGSL
ncbi:MAG TPA: zeta toxin family protein, partial [Phnomibacter sp.]|nr:zeta toxin family protein [Phnomibacter sp.]